MNETLESVRRLQKEARQAALINIALFAVTVISFFSVMTLSGGIGIIIAIGFGLASVIVYFTYTAKKIKNYSAFYKRVFVYEALKANFDDLVFTPEYGISESVIAGTNMMMLGNRYHSDDYIRGSYKGIRFEQSDVCIENVTTDSEGHTHTTTYFKGRWMIFEFNKSFYCDLQIRESGFGYSKRKGGLFSRKEERMKKFELENPDFNKRFDVYAQSQHEAFYICTPHLMENLMKLANSTNGKLLLCFVDSRLHIGLNNNKNAFEAPLFRAVTERETDAIFGEISVITRFVDELKLDNDLYKKD